jgi:hypothetical protein
MDNIAAATQSFNLLEYCTLSILRGLGRQLCRERHERYLKSGVRIRLEKHFGKQT